MRSFLPPGNSGEGAAAPSPEPEDTQILIQDLRFDWNTFSRMLAALIVDYTLNVVATLLFALLLGWLLTLSPLGTFLETGLRQIPGLHRLSLMQMAAVFTFAGLFFKLFLTFSIATTHLKIALEKSHYLG